MAVSRPRALGRIARRTFRLYRAVSTTRKHTRNEYAFRLNRSGALGYGPSMRSKALPAPLENDRLVVELSGHTLTIPVAFSDAIRSRAKHCSPADACWRRVLGRRFPGPCAPVLRPASYPVRSRRALGGQNSVGTTSRNFSSEGGLSAGYRPPSSFESSSPSLLAGGQAMRGNAGRGEGREEMRGQGHTPASHVPSSTFHS